MLVLDYWNHILYYYLQKAGLFLHINYYLNVCCYSSCYLNFHYFYYFYLTLKYYQCQIIAPLLFLLTKSFLVFQSQCLVT